ncbi:beta-N-acetylhexosaminidase [Candidatus Tokpelaia sp.]|uniref:beta-N-acetylhexosaminidase n=1 Tax=Candidatus Tokpelaia sp. TaxID=2233777 RepID=UPI00123AFAAF|nr:beta-N-acetylhexosaminidase [Candidatus Tokpelaia sp.]KAA6404871.1 beta-N-acetylhexosaminidase [Candidatus Tokpelaia sp.]
MQNYRAFITGLAGPRLNGEEKSFIAEYAPWGFVLFARNIKTAAQIKTLIDDLRKATGRQHLPVFIDQEGGRVQRLKPPLAPNYPAAAQIGALYRQNRQQGLRAAWLKARLIALDLRRYGFTADFMPLLDLPVAGSHQIIGDRAYDSRLEAVIALGRETAKALRAGGLLAVMKHIPGHGRAAADTHKEPARVNTAKEVLQKTDFAPFAALAALLPAAMTAHIIYEAYDAGNAATLSKAVIGQVIRREIGFDGLLMSDDLSMQALPGTLAERAKGSFAAGCDIALHCNGAMAEMQAVAAHSPYLAGQALARIERAESWITAPAEIDEQALRAEFAGLMPAAAV